MAKKQKGAMQDLAGEIAGEIADLVTNTKKMGGVMERLEVLERSLGRYSDDIKGLEKRLDHVEGDFDALTDNTKTNLTEVERIISEKWEGLEDEKNQDIMNIIDQVQRLRDAVVKLGIEVKRVREEA